MTFTIDDREFDLVPLPVEVSLDLLTQAIELAGSSLDMSGGANVAGLVKVIGAVPAAVRTFAKHSKVKISGNMVDLAPFMGDVFGRKQTLLIAWLSHCIREEYADFFGEDGQRRLAAAGAAWSGLLGSIGGSGE
jgi:hypothetical protein